MIYSCAVESIESHAETSLLDSVNTPNELVFIHPLRVLISFPSIPGNGASDVDDNNLQDLSRRNEVLEDLIMRQNLVFVPPKSLTRCRLRHLATMLQNDRLFKSSPSQWSLL